MESPSKNSDIILPEILDKINTRNKYYQDFLLYDKFLEEIKYRKNNIFLPSSTMYDVGGGVLKKNGQKMLWRRLSVESFATQRVEAQVDENESIIKNKRIEKNQQKNPRVIDPHLYDSIDELFDACEIWWVRRYRKKESTWKDYENKLKTMINHPIYPIDVFDINPDQVVAQLDFIEDQWRSKPGNKNLIEGSYAIIDRLKAIKALMRSYGKISEIDSWDYYPPSEPAAKTRAIPPVNIVYKLIHYDYSKDPYEKRLYQYLMLFGHWIGPRPSSELSIMKVDDFDEDTRSLIWYQPKVDRFRPITLEEQIAKSSKNAKTFKNWIDIWRPKVENQYSKDFMFLQPSGRPFTKHTLAKKLRENGIEVWDKFSPYSMRHFCVTGRLVKSKVESGYFDIKGVRDYMDHDKTSTTDRYCKEASRWYKLQPFDWFSALLRFNESTIERHKNAGSLKGNNKHQKKYNKTVERPNKASLFDFTPRNNNSPDQI